jgi:hypothetical protein
MVLCSECPAETSSLPPLTSTSFCLEVIASTYTFIGATATGTAPGVQSTAGSHTGSSSSSGGNTLSAGAAAGIGVGGALVAVGIAALIFFLCRRARKRKQMRNQPPSNFGSSMHHPSITPSSPPPQFPSPFEQPQEMKMGFNEPPAMPVVPHYGHQRTLSHELETSLPASSPQMSAYQSQHESITPKRLPSPQVVAIHAPQPRSPPPALTSSGFQYHHQSMGQVSPPLGGQRTPGSNPDSASYGFPSHEASPNPEAEGFQFQQQMGPGSPESQQRLFPRRQVGSPNLRGGSQ